MKILFAVSFCLSVLARVSVYAAKPLWWKWNSQIANDPKRSAIMCNALTMLNKKQQGLCIKYPQLMVHIMSGAKTAVEECGRQLSTNRWNCSNVPEQGSLFGPILSVGCRESAFLYAITSAGVAHSVTSACSSGEYRSCGCARSTSLRPSGDWKWQGCHSDVKFSGSLTKQFANARDTKNGSPQRKKMNRHNIRAGVKALGKLTYRKCKCHGVCGSCELKTCWMQHPTEFEVIANHVKTKYNDAVEMVKSTRGTRVLRVKDRGSRKPSSGDLIYYEASPNFCDVNPTYGTPGTSGRVCNISSLAIDGCNLLCCGRGYNVQVVTDTVKCNCRFFWCCHVKCDTCTNKREIYTCK